MKLSVVAPVYNEEGNVAELHKQILASVTSLKDKKKIDEFEIILVNDGSSDKTLEIMKTLKPMKLISFRRNFGQTAGLDAGIKAATGDILVTLDADLQNDPADFEMLLDKMNEGYDVVCGWRHKRKDSFSKRYISKGAKLLRRMLVDDGIHDSGCTLKMYKTECFNGIDLQGEMHRFIAAILRWQGYRITEVKVNHRPRVSGKSKYNWKRMIKGFVDMISIWFWRKYSARPLHLLGGGGMSLFGFGLLMILLSITDKLILRQDLSDTALFSIALFFCTSGVICFTAGILADISIKTYYKAANLRPYNIKIVEEIR
ncbi:MAG: glycosyltransferase [bacterium]